jgi:hypothetical protein
LYWVGLVFNATGVPSIGRTNAAVFGTNVANLPASGLRWAVNGTLQTTLSNITPGSNSTSGASAFWAAVG